MERTTFSWVFTACVCSHVALMSYAHGKIRVNSCEKNSCFLPFSALLTRSFFFAGTFSSSAGNMENRARFAVVTQDTTFAFLSVAFPETSDEHVEFHNYKNHLAGKVSAHMLERDCFTMCRREVLWKPECQKEWKHFLWKSDNIQHQFSFDWIASSKATVPESHFQFWWIPQPEKKGRRKTRKAKNFSLTVESHSCCL